MAKVIERKRWVNPDASFTVSIYGAAPQGDGWVIETDGYTIRWDDGTVGLPYRYARTDAFQSRERVEAIMQEAVGNGFKGFGQF